MPEVLVIGGGWAGIAAAVTIGKRNVGRASSGTPTVTLVEERQYLGGRARSFTDRTTGVMIDNGQHLMVGAYHEMLGLLENLGTREKVHVQDALRVVFVDADGNRDVLDASSAPGSLGVALGMLKLKRLTWKSRRALLRFAMRLKLGVIDPGDRTCRELLVDERQTEQAIKRFWEPIVLATINAPIDTADGALLLAVMKLAFLGSGHDSKLIVPDRGLSELCEPLLHQPWVDVRLSTSVDRFEIVEGRISRVFLSDGSSIQPRHVVAAVPTVALSRLLPNVPLPTFESSPIISVYLWYDEDWLDEDIVAMLGTTIQWVFRKQSKGLISLTVSSASEIVRHDAVEIVATCQAELRRAFPGLSGRTLLHSQVIKEKTATPLFRPHERSKRRLDSTMLPSNLTIAGDWTDTGLPATLEGAVRSGQNASSHV